MAILDPEVEFREYEIKRKYLAAVMANETWREAAVAAFTKVSKGSAQTGDAASHRISGCVSFVEALEQMCKPNPTVKSARIEGL